jgi:hypothetical protein
LRKRSQVILAVMLLGGPPGVAYSIGEDKRVRQLPNDRELREIGENGSRVKACTRILLVVDQWGILGQHSDSTKKQHRRY